MRKMKRNTVETVVAFFGLALVYYGAHVEQCLHPAGQPAPNCHFTPTGTSIFVIGMIVCLIGIAPWKIYARNYVCQLCGAEFGGGSEGKLSESAHIKNNHPDFYKWDVRWSRWTGIFAIFSFVYIIGIGLLISSLPSLNGLTDWWFIGFVGVMAALLLDLADLHFVTKRFRNKWLLVHPDTREPETLRIEPEKLSAGVTAWREFTHGQEKIFSGVMSVGLKKKGNFAGGYGVYFTSQRIVGVKASRWFVVILALAALAAIGGVSAIGILVGTSPALAYFIALPIILILIAWGQRRLRFQDPLTLEELERRKDFEIRRENISEIELKKPGVVRRGHLIITAKVGKGFTVMLTQQAGVFERLKGLVSGFSYVPPLAAVKGVPPPTNFPTPQSQEYDAQSASDGTQGFLDEKHVEQ